MFYIETKGIGTGWTASKLSFQPETKTSRGVTRLKSVGGYPMRVRNIKPIDPGHQKLTIAQLSNVYGKGAKFGNCR